MLKKVFIIFLLTLFLTTFSASKANAASYYFNGNSSFEWDDQNNWFLDSDFLIAANGTPGSTDDAYIEANIVSLAAPVTVANLFIGQVNNAYIDGVDIEITVTGTTTVGHSDGWQAYIGSDVTIHGNVVFGPLTYNNGVIDGDAIFYAGDSSNTLNGIITGNATFDAITFNEGTVGTGAIFNGSSYNNGTVTGTTTFNGASLNNGGAIVVGSAIFNGTTYNAGTVATNATFNASSTDQGVVEGNAVFYGDSTTNTAGALAVWGTATFYDNSICNDSELSDANFYDNSHSNCPISGTATFYEDDSDYFYYGGDDETMQTKIRHYTSDATTTRDFYNNTPPLSFPWTIIADGAVVNIMGAVVTGSTLSPINGGKFITDLPTVTTASASSLTTTGVTLNGEITDTGVVIQAGAEDVAQHGFTYGIVANLSTVIATSTLGTLGATIYNQSISGLTCATIYYYRSYATNPAGTSFGSIQSFTTSACAIVSYPPTPTRSSGGSRKVAPQAMPAILPVTMPTTTTISGISPILPFTRNLITGSSGNDVKNLQRYLNSKGFTVALTGPGSQGNETNYFGALTRQALARFQKANNIYPSVGYFGPITRGFISKNP